MYSCCDYQCYKRFYGTDLCRSESNKDHSLFYIFCLYTERSDSTFFVLRWGLLGATLAIVISYLVNVIMRIYLIRSVVCVHFDRNTLLFLSVMLTISLFVYYSGGTIGNILMVLFLVLIGIVRFKEQFYMLVKKAK